MSKETDALCPRGMNQFKSVVSSLLELADVRLDGERAWDIHVLTDDFYERLVTQGSLGLGESYVERWWDVERLDEFFHKVISAGLENKVRKLRLLIPVIKAKVLNLQSRARAFRVGEAHYDLGNEFFQHMLDKRLVYTCGYWKHAANLDDAQEAKLDLVCRKIGLKSENKVLDIGSGWGSFAKFAAEQYGARVVGITVSKEQVAFSRHLCRGLPVEVRLQDYRDVDEPFDHIVSLGMFEHVGSKNYRTYLQVVHRCLKDNGLFLLHTIGNRTVTYGTDPWISKYVFPNGEIPLLHQIAKAAQNLFVIEDLHNFGADYDKTLMAWFENFDRAWPKFSERYGERFYRMWKYYLLCCAGAFRARDLQLWQIVLSPQGVPAGYRRICD